VAFVAMLNENGADFLLEELQFSGLLGVGLKILR
jgi:hypothetical protein